MDQKTRATIEDTKKEALGILEEAKIKQKDFLIKYLERELPSLRIMARTRGKSERILTAKIFSMKKFLHLIS